MSQSLRVAAVQLNSGEIVKDNLSMCAELIGSAVDQGAQLVVLPENFAFMGTEVDKRAIAENLEGPKGPIRSALSEVASRNRIYILAGGWPLASGDPMRPFNAASVFGPTGDVIATYRKIHLFDVDAPDGVSYRESDGVSPGSELVCTSIGEFRVGLSICYDLRFPELYRGLVDNGAEVICIPAAFTAATGRSHWEVLCRARAIESQCYVVAAGQVGRHLGNRETFGHSLIIDPWGDVVADAGDGIGVVLADIDKERLAGIRTRLPSLKHRRLLR